MLKVRQRMRTSKDALQKLTPGAAAASIAIAVSQPADEAEDDTCIICLDLPASMMFQPCSHCVTCPACAKLVMQAQQTCPMC